MTPEVRIARGKLGESIALTVVYSGYIGDKIRIKWAQRIDNSREERDL